MAGERFLLSGDQVADYASASLTYPPPGFRAAIELLGISQYGDDSTRFFLVRTEGDGGHVRSGHRFALHAAVAGNGGMAPGDRPLATDLVATPEAFDGAATGDSHMIFGFGGGPNLVVNLDGFGGAATFAGNAADMIPAEDGGMSLAELRAADPDRPLCFAAGTPVDTSRGMVAVEELRVGDEVVTREFGLRPVTWIDSRDLVHPPGDDKLKPVVLRAGSLGPGVPVEDVAVAPSHRVMVEGWRCRLYFGREAVLVPARFLLNGTTIRRDTGQARTTYWHFLLDRPAIVYCAGLRCEAPHAATPLPARTAPAAWRDLHAAGPVAEPPTIGRNEAALLQFRGVDEPRRPRTVPLSRPGPAIQRRPRPGNPTRPLTAPRRDA